MKCLAVGRPKLFWSNVLFGNQFWLGGGGFHGRLIQDGLGGGRRGRVTATTARRETAPGGHNFHGSCFRRGCGGCCAGASTTAGAAGQALARTTGEPVTRRRAPVHIVRCDNCMPCRGRKEWAPVDVECHGLFSAGRSGRGQDGNERIHGRRGLDALNFAFIKLIMRISSVCSSN